MSADSRANPAIHLSDDAERVAMLVRRGDPLWDAVQSEDPERTAAVIQSLVARLDLLEGTLRETYEMLRDSTPGPLPDDAPVLGVLRQARAVLGVENGRPVEAPDGR